MPPKKRGGAAAAASPAARKRLTTAAAKKRATPTKKPQDGSDGTSPSAAALLANEPAAVNALPAVPMSPQVTESPGRKVEHVLDSGTPAGGGGSSLDCAVSGKEGFSEAHAAAEPMEGEDVTTAKHSGDALEEQTGMDVAIFDGLVNGSLVGEEEPQNVETPEETCVAFAAAGSLEKGLDAHTLAGADDIEEAAENAADKEDIASGAEDAAAKVNDSSSKVEEASEMVAEYGPRARTPPSGTDASNTADAHHTGSGATDLPAPLAGLLLRQMRPPSLSIVHGVDELRGVSTSLSTFIRCWDRMCHHLDSIQTSMDILSRSHGAHSLSTIPSTGSKRQLEDMETKGDEREKSSVLGEVEQKSVKDADCGEDAKKPEQSQKSPPLDLESICAKMLGRNLRRYVVSHMSDVDRLREEVPRALRLAPDPSKLVLSCIGRFYLQGSKAYVDPNSPMVSVRRACILVLEFFLLSGCPFSASAHLSSASSDASTTHSVACEVAMEGREKSAEEKMESEEGKKESSSVIQEARVAAVAWKNRLVAEGGISLASAVDALGLALLVASFGIPPDFDSQMLYDVFRLCNMKKKADILRQSPIIVQKLPDVIQDLVQNEKYIAAADLACGFGLQEKYPPLDLISSFLIKTNTDVKEERREGQSSLMSQKEAAARQLSAYRSVVKCLTDHKLDPSSLASFKIEEKIQELEKDIAILGKKLKEKTLKRKAENVGQAYEAKGPTKRPLPAVTRSTAGGSLPPAWPNPGHHVPPLSRNFYSSISSNRFSSLFDGSAGNLTAVGYSSVGNNSVLPPSAESGGASYYSSFGGHGYMGMGVNSEQRSSFIGGSLKASAGSRAMGSGASSMSLYGFADNVVENELQHYGRSTRSNAFPDSA